MGEKPILFSTPMVRAILDGRKTQTRRVIKGDILPGWNQEKQTSCYLKVKDGRPYGNVVKPSYHPGDILWVRETFFEYAGVNCCCSHYGHECKCDEYWYRADPESEFANKCEYPEDRVKWKPSIYMPRKVARIFLNVKDVRVERVQEITDEDILSEGFRMDNTAIFTKGYQGAFKILWDSLNAKRGYGWDENPWVWVYKFERLNNYPGKEETK